MKVERIVAGMYRVGEWTITRQEGAAFGYEWLAHHADIEECFFHTLKEAIEHCSKH